MKNVDLSQIYTLWHCANSFGLGEWLTAKRLSEKIWFFQTNDNIGGHFSLVKVGSLGEIKEFVREKYSDKKMAEEILSL